MCESIREYFENLKPILSRRFCSTIQAIKFEVAEGNVISSPTQQPTEYSLDELLARCNADTMELDDEDRKWLNETPVGREVP